MQILRFNDINFPDIFSSWKSSNDHNLSILNSEIVGVGLKQQSQSQKDLGLPQKNDLNRDCDTKAFESQPWVASSRIVIGGLTRTHR